MPILHMLILHMSIQHTLLSSLWVSCTGSTSDWCALQEVLYKCIDTIQYAHPTYVLIGSGKVGSYIIFLHIPTLHMSILHVPILHMSILHLPILHLSILHMS